MSDGRRREVRTRQPWELTVARALTAPLLLVAAGLLALHALGNLETRPHLAGTLLLLAGAWGWAIGRLRARSAADKSVAELQALSPAEFEEWVAARFREQGYKVRLTGMGGDHGADVLAEKPGELVIVQCKRYRTTTVSEAMLRDLYGAMHDFGADAACLVTTGRLTRAAEAWARGKPITIWARDDLARLARQRRHSGSAPEADASVCPRCGDPLELHRHPQSGQLLLRCSRHPRCRHTQPIAQT
jgi:restriction system protein